MTGVQTCALPICSGDLPEGYAAYRVPYDRTDELAGEIRTHGAGVLVIEPGEVRDAVIAGLRAVADRPLSEEVR